MSVIVVAAAADDGENGGGGGGVDGVANLTLILNCASGVQGLSGSAGAFVVHSMIRNSRH